MPSGMFLKIILLALYKGPVIRATISFNLSRNIVARQVETYCCVYYQLRKQLVSQKIQCCKLRQHVARSRLEFYFLQQILVLLLSDTFKFALHKKLEYYRYLWDHLIC